MLALSAINASGFAAASTANVANSEARVADLSSRNEKKDFVTNLKQVNKFRKYLARELNANCARRHTFHVIVYLNPSV